MSTNKNASARYLALDKCFRNKGRNYSINDLVDACNEVLVDLNPDSTGVRKRQVYKDIDFMKDTKGYEAPIVTTKNGRRAYYHYDEPDFSITSQPLNQTEAQQLKESLVTLSRFKGLPQFEWVEELKVRLEESFKLGDNDNIISFDENPYYSGKEHISKLYTSILNKAVLKITYQSFKQDHPVEYEISPYHIKQYNNRWFLFGYNHGNQKIQNLALDRIQKILDDSTIYVTNKEIDFGELFEDIVGVTVLADAKPVKALLKINSPLWPYIKTKPLHGSQKTVEITNEYTIIQLDIVPTFELESLLLSFGESIEVMEPEPLRSHLKERLNTAAKKYL